MHVGASRGRESRLRIHDNRRMAGTFLIKAERIERRVLRIRGQNVMLDEDLATLYRVDVKRLVRP